MKKTIITGAQTLADAVQLARLRMAQAQSTATSAKEQARLAKRRRKEAKESARRAKKLAKQAKAALAEATEALALAESQLAMAGESANQALQRGAKQHSLKAPARKSASRRSGSGSAVASITGRPAAKSTVSKGVAPKPPGSVPVIRPAVGGGGLPLTPSRDLAPTGEAASVANSPATVPVLPSPATGTTTGEQP